MKDVETEAGRVRGAAENGVTIFRGVPYGAASRFAVPRPVDAWAGVRDASEFGPMAMQHIADSREVRMSEDCLVLNVWTRDLDPQARRPVMVWCHGGGFSGASGDSYGADGTALARDRDVVVVTFNHRLNAFGFLSLAEFGDEYADTGNLGMLDIVLMLQWVRDNIAAFGGDPGNVTVFGESGGGAKITTLMAMPAARGLFHRAVVQSGAFLRAIPPETAARRTARVARGLGITGNVADGLRRASPKALAAAAGRVEPRAGRLAGFTAGADPTFLLFFAPVVDGRSLPRHPFDPGAPPAASDIPLLIGSTRHDGLVEQDLVPTDRAGLVAEIVTLGLAPDRAEILVDGYAAASPDASPAELYQDLLTDIQFRMPAIRQAERAAAAGAPVYVYEFGWRSAAAGDRATHVIDVPFVFDVVGDDLLAGSDVDRTRALARATSSAWAAFARTGAPGHPALPEWDPYSLPDRVTMNLDLDSTVENDPRATHRRAFGAALS